MKKAMTIVLMVIGGIIFISAGFMGYNKVYPIGLGMHKAVYQKDNIALAGFDVTSYFNGNLTRGSSAYSVEQDGAKWYFASPENKKEFLNDPDFFKPQFGGYCSKAVSTGFVAPADPSIFTIYQDKLYIFSSEKVKDAFIKSPQPMIIACNKNWK